MDKAKIWVFASGFLVALVGCAGVALLVNQKTTLPSEYKENLCGPEASQSQYICAMHPSVSSHQRGYCPVCGMAFTRNPEQADFQTPWVQIPEYFSEYLPVQTIVVNAPEKHLRSITVTGEFQLDERRTFRQTANLPGRIDQLFVKEAGQTVRKGQPIASIYSRELIAVVEAYAFNTTSESVLRSARNNLESWGLTENLVKELIRLPNYRVPVHVTADYSGTVLQVHVREGDHATNTHMGPPTVLFEVADLTKVRAVTEINQEDLKYIQIGSQIELKTSADPYTTYTGTIDWISPVADPLNRTISIKATVENTHGFLKPGLEFSGTLAASTPDRGIKVPESAVLWTGKRSYVYVRGEAFPEGDFFQIREVELSSKLDDHHYLITNGLEEGEIIVTNGAFQIDAAAQLAGKPSMMNPSGTSKATHALKVAEELANDTPSGHSTY